MRLSGKRFGLACLLGLAQPVESQLRSDRPRLNLVRRDHRKKRLSEPSFQGADLSSRLAQCEGHCDDDDDCVLGLVCYQQGIGNAGKVPGCIGRDNSRHSFCTDPDATLPPTVSPSMSPSSPPSRAPTGTPLPADIEDFKLKMYWEESYFWQETNRERRWCMRCPGGSCGNGDSLFLQDCGDSGVEDFDFVYMNREEVLIRIHGTDRCLERRTRQVSVGDCDSGESQQRWIAQNGDFAQHRFEISPSTDVSMCVTQHHHPKAGELVLLAGCHTARSADTSFWERF